MVPNETVVKLAEEMSLEGMPKVVEAMDFVLRGDVDLAARTVRSGSALYTVHPQYGCDCPDARIRKSRCKHQVAVEMAQRLTERGEPMTEEERGMSTDEPDDIPDPVDDTQRGVQAQQILDAIEQKVRQAEESGLTRPFRTEGFQYVDYPSTLCIKLLVGHTDVMWTFRGTDDAEVFRRATPMIKWLDDVAKKKASAPQSQPTPTAPPQPQAGPPLCPVHQRPMRESKFGGWYCGMKNENGEYCKQASHQRSGRRPAG